jgi:8-oxo-dGTP pyrophosphatase MutT (NUDIX family)
MSIEIQGHKLRINLTIPLPYKYRGGGVAVFRINNGKPEVLLGLRANNPGRGTWSFPGGGAEKEERLITAAVREFREETGVQLFRRYITKTGVFQVKRLFFEWNTIIIESTQNIPVRKHPEKNYEFKNRASGEFDSLRWIPVPEIGNYKLHRWVRNVIDFYLSGKMDIYTPKPSDGELKDSSQTETGESLLFDIAEMVLTGVDRDGTKYYRPRYRIVSRDPAAAGALYGV